MTKKRFEIVTKIRSPGSLINQSPNKTLTLLVGVKIGYDGINVCKAPEKYLYSKKEVEIFRLKALYK